MISFKDKTFCGSPHCENKCGRKMTELETIEYKMANMPDQWDGMLGISYGYFCGTVKILDDGQIWCSECENNNLKHEV